ncbi:MutS family DNA mismatch repair protein [Lentilactobacillus senioris DSM 24302 = JCM 17472]|uniref:Endonuclease MutS2 n=1 Tax=Lentilactobacillus senioris DSM 24302 = JCM 17472 TaxID=1423802 RepID=A0A0R2CPL3_9LACO|nr:endonuclease MutS2 [Lentilactobacillus senioris]KRM93694.1 MutS family DNA mismatch repair protein [Lentilactobacillus senioris DSM 24302 = JCM 17472]
MNSKVLDTLEYQKIKDQLLPFLSTDQGRQVVKELLPSSDVNVVAKWLDQSADGATIMRLEGEIPIPKLDDISNIIKRLNIEDASLSGTELAAVTKLLRTTQAIYNFFESLKVNEVELRTLNQLVDRLSLQPEVTQQLVSSIAEDGRILDGASRELRSIRAQITRTQAEIRGIMNHFIKGASAKYLSEPIITIRDDRFVLPIKAEYKQSFGGIIHDQSASGQTLYVEPNNVVEKNNQLRRDKLAERVEERRILAELTELLRPIRNEMKFNGNIIGQLDFINAKAKLAHQTHSTEPALSIDNDVNLRQARHPLIDPQMVVANDIAIGSDYRTIIVTGPNTGGKTIMMKTLGLLQLMGQSGMFIPALEHSQIGIFDDIFADIGDDQSIEASLSTFSSHMDNVINILNQATNHSLILLDELGAGTDPKEGAALAMAIIDRVTEIGSELVATTHYPELKAFAYNRPNTINASMEFDFEKLQPTYRFLIGIPGQSNALSIVEKLGLDKQVVSNARDFTDEDSQDINTMIDELTEQTKKARQEADELKVELADATDLHRDLTTAYEKYQANKEQLAEKAREQANQVVEEAKGKADTIIADLRAKQQQVANSPVKENELMDAKGALNSLEVAPQLKKNKVLRREKAKHDFHEGDEVLVKSYGQPGTLVRKMGNHSWEVQIGILKMKLDESDLEKGSAPKPKKAARPRVARTKSAGTSPTLDLRGQRYEEAMHSLDQYIDAALVSGYPTVTIIHGKGTGALRQGVNDYLSSHPQVKSFGYSAPNAGGDGSTVVKFK